MAIYDLSGRLTLGFDEDDAAVARLLAAQMDPLQPRPAPAEPADVVLEPALARGAPLVDVQNAARDGMVTASDGDRLVVLAGGLRCAVADPLHERPIRFSYERGFPLRRIYAPLVRPSLQLGLHAHEAVAVHSAAVELD